MSDNSNLHTAKKQKNDEFYTLYKDIENEVNYYKQHLKNKVVYCNCDEVKVSNFFNYFYENFKELDLKELITTCYKKDGKGIFSRYNGNDLIISELQGNGDFRSAECFEFLKESDIVVTNPPFSLFRDYVATLVEYGKQFLILGNNNAITYKEIFPLIKENKMWLGVNSNKTMEFRLPNHYEKWNRIENDVKIGKVPAISWFTNLEHKKRNYPMDLYMKYSNEYYPKYDNYDAIEVSKTCEIPMDYEGVMGVPITFLDKYNPNQFEIIGLCADKRDNIDCFIKASEYYLDDKHKKFVGLVVNGKATYARILIRHKKI